VWKKGTVEREVQFGAFFRGRRLFSHMWYLGKSSKKAETHGKRKIMWNSEREAFPSRKVTLTHP